MPRSHEWAGAYAAAGVDAVIVCREALLPGKIRGSSASSHTEPVRPNEALPTARYSKMSFEMDGNADQPRAPVGSSMMKLSRIELAKLGEEHAAKLVASLGYRIVKRNFRYGKVGEIDIVAYDGDCLVFIEVKARQDHSHGTPEASIDVRKQAQLKKVARMYYYVNAIGEAVCRFDVVAVDIFGKKVDIRHHKNAFQ